MKKRVYHWVFGLCDLAGFMTIFGVAGASDLNLIDMNTIIVKSCIGVVLLVIGYIGLKLSGWKYIA